MSEVAANAILPGRRRRQQQATRVIQYLLLQALIAVLCVLALRQSLPAPPAQYLTTEFRMTEGGTERAVTLPHFTASRYASEASPRFNAQFVRPRDEAGRVWSVFLPRFTNGVEVTVNGVIVHDSRRDPAANRPDRNTPQIAAIPAPILRDGVNDLSIRLFVWGPIPGFLDRVWVGPDEELRPYYDMRTQLFVTLPVVFSAWQAILAVILGIMWVMRRHEPAYGVLAAAMAVGFLQAFLQTPMGETPLSRLSVILISSAPLESALVLTFALLLCGWRWQRWWLVFFVPGILLALGGLIGGQAWSRAMFPLLAVPMIGLSLLIMAVATARSAVRQQNVASFLLGCAVTIMLTCWIVDLLSVFQVVPNRIFTARLSYSVMLVAIGAGLTWRFARALNQVDSFAGRLVTQVREAEDRLKAASNNQGFRVECQQRAGGAEGPDLAVMPEPRRRVAGGGVPQRAGGLVEHDETQGDELLVAGLGRDDGVELLQRLGRVPVLAQEDPQQVLDLEGGDRRLDAVAGDVADDRGHPLGAGGGHVVEVAGHEPRAGLVGPADLEALELGQLLGGEPGGPAPGGQVLLGEHLLGPPLQAGPLLDEVGLGQEALAPDEGHGDGDDQQGLGEPRPGADEGGAGRDDGHHHVQQAGVDLLAVAPIGPGWPPCCPAGPLPSPKPPPRPLQPQCRPGPDDGRHEHPADDQQKDRDHLHQDRRELPAAPLAEAGSAGRSDAELQGRRPEPEVLTDAALEVAQVRRRQRPVGEQGEGGRVGGALGGVEDPGAGGGLGRLGGLDDLVELPGRHPPVVGLDGLLDGREQLVDPLAGQGADLEHRGVAEERQPVGHLLGDLGPRLGVEQVHLFSTMTTGLPAASMRSARRWSWWVTPWEASMTSMAASARSTVCRARTSE